MSLKRSMIAAAALAVALTAIPTVAASATTTVNAGGGLWQYGVDGNVFSNYHHETKSHTATACDNGYLKTCKQVAAVRGQWARASTSASWNGGNTAFWNTL